MESQSLGQQPNNKNLVKRYHIIIYLFIYFSVSCGDSFSMFVSDNGLLLSCGSGQYGCLGQGDRSDGLKPKLIESLLQEDVIHVSCGPHHVAAVCSAGGVFTWGKNSAGQLGLGTNANR